MARARRSSFKVGTVEGKPDVAHLWLVRLDKKTWKSGRYKRQCLVCGVSFEPNIKILIDKQTGRIAHVGCVPEEARRGCREKVRPDEEEKVPLENA